MSTDTSPGLTTDNCCELGHLVRGADSIELKLTVPERVLPVGGGGARRRSARGADPPGVLLRHARPDAQQGRRRRPGATDPGQGRRLGRQAASGRPAASCRRRCARSPNFVVEVDAMPGGYVCSGSMKAQAAADGRAAVGVGREAAAQAVLQGAAGVLRRPRARGPRPRRPLGARADLRAQAEDAAGHVLAPARRRDVDLPRRQPRSSSCRRSACPAKGSTSPTKPAPSCSARASRLSGDQQTKTKTALEFFSAELQAATRMTAPTRAEKRKWDGTLSSSCAGASWCRLRSTR